MENINELTDTELLKIYQKIQEIIKYLDSEKKSLEKIGEENV